MAVWQNLRILILLVVISLSLARTFHANSFSFIDNDIEAVKVIHQDKFDMHDEKINENPPPYTEYAKVARYLVHKSEWTSMSTFSKKFPTYPMVNIISVADSAKEEKSTGKIFFLLTDLDFTGQDLEINNNTSLLFTQEQDLSCSSANTDPMEPTCARVIISGTVEKVC